MPLLAESKHIRASHIDLSYVFLQFSLGIVRRSDLREQAVYLRSEMHKLVMALRFELQNIGQWDVFIGYGDCPNQFNLCGFAIDKLAI